MLAGHRSKPSMTTGYRFRTPQSARPKLKSQMPLKLYPIGGHTPASCAILPTTRGAATHGIHLNILNINIVETNVA